jgi:hypothetical protein
MSKRQKVFVLGPTRIFKGDDKGHNRGHIVVERSIFRAKEEGYHQDILNLRTNSITIFSLPIRPILLSALQIC